MVSQQERIFSISHRPLLLLWLLFLLLFVSTIFIPFMIATAGQAYPDLSDVPIFYAASGFLWVGLLVEYSLQTISVQLEDNQLIVRKWLQTEKRVDYNAILAHNERLDVGKGGAFNVLTVYLQDDYFVIKSNEFPDYSLLKDQLCQYGQSVTYQKVMTLTERNRLRWVTAGLALFIVANIIFGYLAHDAPSPDPARLATVTDIVDKVIEDRPKGMLKGVTVSLRTYPAFSFYVSRRDYDIRLDTLQWAMMPQRPIELLIRESDYRKKLMETEPLTFGDKYVNYKQILVFGVNQGKAVQIKAAGPVYEPTHTNPLQRTFLLSFLLILCWTGWVYVDQHKVLRAD